MKRFFQKNTWKAHPEYRYLLFLPCFLVCFWLTERLVPSDGDYWVSHCPLDDCIPFLEIFVIPYCLWYPLLFGVGISLLVRDVPEFQRYVRFLIIGFGFSLLFCLVFPNGQDLRPAAFPRQNFCTWLLGRIYAVDTNTNVMPSMHVIGCAAACLGACYSRCLRGWRWPTVLVSLLICVSTIFVKQHSVLDLLAAVIVAVPIWWLLYFRPDRKQKTTKKEKS